LPEGQKGQLAADSSIVYSPCRQFKHELAAAMFWNLPRMQAGHQIDPVLFWNFPAGQSEHPTLAWKS
jgi:hypothetical protein